MHSIYVYLLGNDFPDANAFLGKLEAYIDSHDWAFKKPAVVDQSRITADGTPEWDFGLNLDLPELYLESEDWFSDLESIVSRFIDWNDLHFGFVIGIADKDSGIAEDIIEVDSDTVDLDQIRRFLGLNTRQA